MPKVLKVSDEAHQMLIRVMGEFTAKLGKRLTLEEALMELIREHYEKAGSSSR